MRVSQTERKFALFYGHTPNLTVRNYKKCDCAEIHFHLVSVDKLETEEFNRYITNQSPEGIN